MALARDIAICLRKVEYSETSQILQLLGRERGLMRLIAKGAHRTTKAGASKFGGGIDLLDEGEAVFTDRPEKDLATLCEWKLQDGHLDVRRNLRAVYLGQYAAELVGLLIEEHDPHPELFDALKSAITLLATPALEEAFLDFEIALLRSAGYLPHLDSCISCTHPPESGAPVFFSPANGGLLCRSCADSFPDRMGIDRRLVDLVRAMSAGRLPRLPRLTRHQTDPINRILAGHIEHTLGRRLRLPAYVLG